VAIPVPTPPAAPPRALGTGARRLRVAARNRLTLAGAGLIALILVASFGAPLFTHYAPNATDFMHALLPPSPQHPFGTDDLGRDLYTRVLYGGRDSLVAGFVSVAIALVVGVPFGLLAGYLGGWVDEVVMRVTDAALAFPGLVLALAIAAMLGPGLLNAMIAVALVTIPTFVRVARARVLSLRSQDFVEAARSIGVPLTRLLWRHVLPNALTPILVLASLNIGSAIITEASLSFLGLGAQPPAPSWGFMLRSGADYLARAPWMSIYPGLAIFAAVLGFNLLGDGLRDYFDPMTKA
jgi:peptide/nickel transport system permease protein